MYYFFAAVLVLTIWIGWEIHRAPLIEDEKIIFDDDDDPTTTCWDDDNKDGNHTEPHF